MNMQQMRASRRMLNYDEFIAENLVKLFMLDESDNDEQQETLMMLFGDPAESDFSLYNVYVYDDEFKAVIIGGATSWHESTVAVGGTITFLPPTASLEDAEEQIFKYAEKRLLKAEMKKTFH